MKFIFIYLVFTIFYSAFVDAQRQRRQRRIEERDITKEEILEITDDKEILDQSTKEYSAITEEWDKHMSDFVPEDML